MTILRRFRRRRPQNICQTAKHLFPILSSPSFSIIPPFFNICPKCLQPLSDLCSHALICKTSEALTAWLAVKGVFSWCAFPHRQTTHVHSSLHPQPLLSVILMFWLALLSIYKHIVFTFLKSPSSFYHYHYLNYCRPSGVLGDHCVVFLPLQINAIVSLIVLYAVRHRFPHFRSFWLQFLLLTYDSSSWGLWPGYQDRSLSVRLCAVRAGRSTALPNHVSLREFEALT